MMPDWAVDRSGLNEVLHHLQDCDTAFHPPLSRRVDLASYAEKLVRQSLRVESWDGDRLVGLVAVYCNDPGQGTAFVSNVSVSPDFARQGIARHLLQAAIAHVRALGFQRLHLEVDPQALPALRLYDSLGFQPTGGDQPSPVRLGLDLSTGAARNA